MARGGAVAAGAGAGAIAGLGYYLIVSGKLTIDTGWGRRIRPLGPFSVQIAAPAVTVFDVIAAPYLGRTPRAMAAHLRVIERGKTWCLRSTTPRYIAVGSPPSRSRPSSSTGRAGSLSVLSAAPYRTSLRSSPSPSTTG